MTDEQIQSMIDRLSRLQAGFDLLLFDHFSYLYEGYMKDGFTKQISLRMAENEINRLKETHSQ